MTPEELAARHPCLYHITAPGAGESIKQKGLLSTSCILDLYNIQGASRVNIELHRRPSEITLEHAQYGRIVINDNIPLTESALAKCLEDDLTPSDWLRLLNARVFFWASKQSLERHLNARLNCNRQREVIVVDTLSLAKAHAERMELSPINSGATLRKAARRGLKTFTPLLQYTLDEWRKLRGGRDDIREITVRNSVKDITNYIITIYTT
ncbi:MULTISPECIES: DUF7002 family protein [Legionella]|uniref:Uncharacterized protein n=1 Tax=Legionella maceachernii TaxID=466 RepID=A0A0W0VW79_9GAMM|nr:hypothetical protein [Legionella maceachernii]KTD24241.1 hypothetical protein Lmac_3114 [Legionella maceachernii]SJZ89937.1 hypothetical protein SAMN02745128_01411 [Legionella maceachernii]SUO98742.1 Uncharacterised protein [Legionella maceachernii]